VAAAFRLIFTQESAEQLVALGRDAGLTKRHRAVRKTLALLEQNPKYPSLNSHKYDLLSGPNGEDAWESYAENKTPAAFRVFWYYGPGLGVITILAITAHP
jgi:hypothetical protein